MSLKTSALKIGLALSVLSGAQNIDASESGKENSLYPQLVSKHFHEQIDTIMLPETCAPAHVKIDYEKKDDGQMYMKSLSKTPTKLDGTLTRLHITCADGSKSTIGDGTMPVSGATQIDIHSGENTIGSIEQEARSYSLQAFPEVVIQLDKHHGKIPFQNLTSLEDALESIKSLGLNNPLRKVSIRRLDSANAYAEEATSKFTAPDEIVISEQMLNEFSKEELAIVIRHEIFHLIDENSVNPAWDSVKADIFDAIEGLSVEEKHVFSQNVNETKYYSSVFSKSHTAEPKDDHELPIMFLNTRSHELALRGHSPEAYKKAALELIEQLSKQK